MNLKDVRTEKQLRAMAVEIAQSWVGILEGSEGHKVIIGIYNNQKNLPRSYKLKVTDSWCAGTTSAIFIVLEMTEYAPTECSCPYMVKKYQAKGQWIEDDKYIPMFGDVIMYDWEDDGVGDNKGAPNHVGIVEKVVNGKITVIEGNYSNRVKRRVLSVGGRNTFTVESRCKVSGGEYGDPQAASTGRPVVSGGDLSPYQIYIVQLMIRDALNETPYFITIPNEREIFKIKDGGRSVGIGTIPVEDDLMDVGIDARFQGAVEIGTDGTPAILFTVGGQPVGTIGSKTIKGQFGEMFIRVYSESGDYKEYTWKYE